MARYMRSDLGRGHTRLNPPVVVGGGIAFYGPRQLLANQRAVQIRTGQRPNAQSALRPPVVVTIPEPFRARPIQVELAAGRNRTEIQRLRPTSALQPPTVTFGAIAWFGPSRRLTNPLARDVTRTNPARYQLQPPSVVNEETFTPCAFTTDTFDRPDEDPIGGIWRAHPLIPANTGRVFNNRFYTNTLTSQGIAQLRQEINPFSPWQISITAYVTSDPDEAVIGASNDTAYPIYIVINAVANRIDLLRGGEGTPLASTARAIADGDKFALDVTPVGANTTYDVWHQPTAGAWQKVISYTGSEVDWSAQGIVRPFIWVEGFTNSLDDFSFCPYTNGGPQVVFAAPQPHGRPLYTLNPPTVVTQPEVFTARPLQIELAAGRNRTELQRLQPTTTLQPPAVVGAGVYFQPIRGHLFPLDRTQLRGFMSRLSPPVVVAFDSFYGPEGKLFPLDRTQLRTAISVLRPPVVVGTEEAFFGPKTTLAPSFRGAPKSVLRGPIIPPLAEPIRVTLVRIRPPKTTAQLQPPTVVFLAVEIYGPRVQLTRIRPPKTTARLLPPIIPPLAEPIRVTLVRISPPQRFSLLQPPTVVASPPVVEDTLRVYLTRITVPQAYPKLQPPTVVSPVLARRIQVTLARGRSGPFRSKLQPPTVVFPFFARPTVVSLAQIRPVPTRTRLQPPVVVGVFTARPPVVRLARITPAPTQTRLAAPTVVFTAVEIYGPVVVLTWITPPPTLALLKPPTAVVPATLIYFGPQVELAAGSRDATDLRRQPTSALHPPVVIGDAVRFPGPGVLWARPDQKQRRRTSWTLQPPAVVRVEELPPAIVVLTPSRRPVTKSTLQPPTVVFTAVEIYGPEVTLARIRPQPTTVALKPPTVVFYPPHRPLAVHLTRIKPQPTTAFLKPPTVVTPPFIAEPVQVTLVRIVPPPVVSALKPPTVVEPPIVHRGLLVFLAPSSRGKPKSFYIKPTTLRFVPDSGDVCGFDIAASFICADEDSPSQVQGYDSAPDAVSGFDRKAT